MKASIAILVGVVMQYASAVEVPPGFECTQYVDIDQCTAGDDICGHAMCTNTFEGYDCSCDGFDTSQENHLLARGKHVRMSGTYNNYFGSNAVDGIYDPADTGINEVASLAQTRRKSNMQSGRASIPTPSKATINVIGIFAPPRYWVGRLWKYNGWIAIDLEDNRCISAVKIWNRRAMARRLRNVYITIAEFRNLEFKKQRLCSYFPGQPANVQRFNCSSTMFGRRVRVGMLNRGKFLHVYEIEVIGY